MRGGQVLGPALGKGEWAGHKSELQSFIRSRLLCPKIKISFNQYLVNQKTKNPKQQQVGLGLRREAGFNSGNWLGEAIDEGTGEERQERDTGLLHLANMVSSKILHGLHINSASVKESRGTRKEGAGDDKGET